jgi:exopolysaccharide production protein ExoZ
MRKLRSIQVLRALAACSVVVLHSYLRSGDFHPNEIRLGAAGVDLFFVISGFIMANVSVGRTWRQFLADRLWRIYPMWWIAAIPWLFAMDRGTHSLLASVTLWPIFGPAFAYPTPLLGWTLCFEMLFYAAMGLALATRPAVPLAMLAITLVLAQTTNIALFAFTGNPLILEFLAGVVVAKLPRDERLGLPLLAVAAVGLVLAPLGFFTLHIADNPQMAAARALFWGGPAAIAVYACLCLDKRFAGRRWNLPVLLGDASYSIYLFHLTVINVLQLNWIAEIGISIVSGLLAYRFIERRIPELRADLARWRSRTDRLPDRRLVARR